MAVKTLGDMLRAAAGVTALVPASRITPLVRPQNIATPAITLQRVSASPVNHLRGWGSLDENSVQVDIWAETYAECVAIADACRAAASSAQFLRTLEIDNTDPALDPILYRITQTYSVWTT